MAETLGSLVDKLSIKNIRIERIKNKKGKKIVNSQRKDLIKEIDLFLSLVAKGKIKLRDEKWKLYEDSVKIKISKIGTLIDKLSKQNIYQWNLEDEVRRTGLSNKKLVAIKRKIDKSNQIRADLVDRLDEILERNITKVKRRTSK